MRLEDYKVRVLPGTTGSTAAKVRVLIESRDAHDRWGTVGVSHDIIDASWQALVDGINYKLYKDEHGAERRGEIANRAISAWQLKELGIIELNGNSSF